MGVIEKIEELMKEKGWTKYRLAKNSGLPQSTITSLLSGRVKNPSTDSLTKIAAALGVSASFLLGETDPVLDEYNRRDSELNNEILATLRLITDDEGYFFEDLRKDVFNAIVSSGLNMSYAFHNASDADYYERFFKNYFASPEEDYTDRQHEEAIEEFNKAYEIRTISSVLGKNDLEKKEKFLSELKKIIEINNIKKPFSDAPESEFLTKLELSDEQLLEQFELTLDGKPLTKEEAMGVIAYLRSFRQLSETKE